MSAIIPFAFIVFLVSIYILIGLIIFYNLITAVCRRRYVSATVTNRNNRRIHDRSRNGNGR